MRPLLYEHDKNDSRNENKATPTMIDVCFAELSIVESRELTELLLPIIGLGKNYYLFI